MSIDQTGEQGSQAKSFRPFPDGGAWWSRHPVDGYDQRSMGQRVTVLEKPSSREGVVRFEINRILTGMGHERYRAGQVIEGNRPPDVLARRLFDRGGIDAVHINTNVITIDLDRGAGTDGIVDIIEDLYTYYLPGVEVPDPASFGAAAG